MSPESDRQEYLQFVIKLYQTGKTKNHPLIIEELTCTFKLDQSLDDYIANYSLGMKQKIYLIAAFLSGARNLLLDEPFNGLDPESAAILKKMLIQAGFRLHGSLFCHNLDLVANFCDEVLFITRDRKIISAVNPKNYALLEKSFFTTVYKRQLKRHPFSRDGGKRFRLKRRFVSPT